MKNTFGTHLTVTLFGESHGPAIGAVLDGMAPGIPVSEEEIREQLSLRRPVGAISTARQEQDDFQFLSGVHGGYTTGTPIAIVIPNRDTRSADYEAFATVARPSHADYTAECKYHGYQDKRGGGHFSGRVTAALVAVGAIVRAALAHKGILIGTHILSCGGVSDRAFDQLERDVETLLHKPFAVLSEEAGEAMQAAILRAKQAGDSVGGVLETAVLGMPAGVGEPWFDTVEGLLSHALFSIPAVKGVEFGDGFAIAQKTGSKANDPLRMQEGKVVSTTNHSGGINGGITNGMPLIWRVAVKPTPTIGLSQESVDLASGENATLVAHGRHDPAIVHRARAVADAVSAIVLADLLIGRYGTDWLA